MTTHEVLPSSAVLRYCSADVNMHTGYPCADKTRPRLRRTCTLSSTMSTTERDIDMAKGELDRLQHAAGCECSSTGADRRGGYQRPAGRVLFRSVKYLSVGATTRRRRDLEGSRRLT